MQNLRNGVEPAMVPQGLMGPMIPVPLDAGNVQVAPMDSTHSPSIPISTLASALASATPEQQRMVWTFLNLLNYFLCMGILFSNKSSSLAAFYVFVPLAKSNKILLYGHQMLGEQIYPLVQQIEHDHAGKVTGMLLEMDQTEVLHLLESPDALQKKVGEAMEILRLAHATGSDAAEQLGSLSLND